jgi:hypothetical protein
MGIATADHVHQWQEQGWVLVPELVPGPEIDAALDDVWQVLPRPGELDRSSEAAGGGVAERRAALLDGGRRRRRSERPPARERGPAFRDDQFLGRQLLPFPGSGALNRMVVHPNVLDFVERALLSRDVRLYQMGLWAKYTGLTDYEQPMHQDQNHSLVPFRAEPGWWHLEGFLYLTDVDDDLAPTHAVSIEHSGRRQQVGSVAPDDDPDLYRAEVAAAGRRGSFLAYRPDVFHRGVNLTRPGGVRVLLNISYKLAGHDWIGFESVQPGVNSASFRQLVAGCTPRQLAVLGVPEPGHPFWTPAMLDAMAARYPDLDLAPWRSACPGDRSDRAPGTPS